jgi:hypothetical protein
MRPGHETEHSPPSTVEVKNEWNYTSTPPVCFMARTVTKLVFIFMPPYVFTDSEYSTESHSVDVLRLRLKCNGTRAETRFRLSAKRTSPFKSAGASVLSTTGSRGVCISGSNDGYTMFRGSL